MHLHNPSLVLFPDTFLSVAEASLSSSGSASSSLLVEFIRDEFPGVPLDPVARKYWNQPCGTVTLPISELREVSHFESRIGLEFIQQLCVEDDERTGTLLAVADKCLITSFFFSILLLT